MTRATWLIPVLFTLACGGGLQTGPCLDTFDAPATATCDVPGYDDRAYDLVLPEAYDGETPVPVVLAFHGGGGNRRGAATTTCATGSIDDPNCLHVHAREHGYAVIFPDGTKGNLGNLRTWNAGGGEGDWRCTSGKACEDNVDDIAYVEALLDDLEARVEVDTTRVYATGLSNGGAISHRLACELDDRIAAIAPIGGGMQLITTGECAPERPVPVLHVHGTADPCWRYVGGVPDCPTGQKDKGHVSVEATLDAWAEINGCGEETEEIELDDTSADGTTTTRIDWQDCEAPVVHLRVNDGGHAWPDGHQYLKEGTVGPVFRDWGNEVLWDFLSQHQLPE